MYHDIIVPKITYLHEDDLALVDSISVKYKKLLNDFHSIPFLIKKIGKYERTASQGIHLFIFLISE